MSGWLLLTKAYMLCLTTFIDMLHCCLSFEYILFHTLHNVKFYSYRSWLQLEVLDVASPLIAEVNVPDAAPDAEMPLCSCCEELVSFVMRTATTTFLLHPFDGLIVSNQLPSWFWSWELLDVPWWHACWAWRWHAGALLMVRNTRSRHVHVTRHPD